MQYPKMMHAVYSRLIPVCLALVLALTAGLNTSMFGQLTRGYISGTVQDSSSAVMPSVAVKAVNKATNLAQVTETNSVGVYRFAAVEPGAYSVEFVKDGFETRRVENVVVGASQEVTLNQTLAVAGATAMIEVVDSPPGVELAKTSPTIDRKLDMRLLENIPLTSGTRDVTRVALLAPTVTRAPGSNEFSANGQRARNNNFLIDGTDNNDLSVTLTTTRLIAEALSEVQVQTSAYSAEFGRNSGAQVSAITRSGTNALHGDVWDYYNANWLEPVSLLNKRANINETPRFVHNQAGGAIGGPIVRNKTFFFGLLETNRRREAPDARNASSITIPTPAGYAALKSVPLGTGQTADSRQAVLNAISFFPEVHSIIPRYDGVKTTNINGVPIEIGTARIPLSNPNDYWYMVNRVDHQLTSSNRINYRLMYDDRVQPDVISNLGFGSRFSGAQAIRAQNHAWSWTSTPKSNLVNEFRAAYIRRNLDFPENDPISPSVGVTGFFTVGGLSNFPQGRFQTTYQFQNVSTWMLGRHSIKFGADLRKNRLLNSAEFDSKGTFTFPTLADFINNNPQTIRQSLNTASFDADQWQTFYFFQDDIKVTRDLTLNLGMRYEYSDVPFGFFGATQPEVRAVGVPGPVKGDKNNWAPRGGLAWSPSFGENTFLGKLFGNGLSVFRGGYGVTYDVLFYNILTVNMNNYPRVVVSEVLRPQTQNVYPQLVTKQTTPVLDPLATFVNSPEDTQNPATHFYSFTIQRQFSKNYIFEAGYTGARSYHGIRQGQGNSPILTPEQAATVRSTRSTGSIPGAQARRLNPAWGSRVMIESTALASYNAMFLKFDKRFADGLTLGGNYTLSKNMSDNDESLGVADITNSSPQIPQNYFNYRPEWSLSVFDRTHRLVTHYQYELPWRASGAAALRHVLGGWMITGFTEFQSGQPFTIRTGVDSAGIGTATPARPDYNPGGQITMDPVMNNLRTFKIPIDGTGIVVTPLTTTGQPLANSMSGGGNLGRNTFRGPGYARWNLSLQKTISVTERWKVRLRSDWLNAFNQRNFGTPEGRMSAGAFGENTTDPGGRTMLLGLKITF